MGYQSIVVGDPCPKQGVSYEGLVHRKMCKTPDYPGGYRPNYTTFLTGKILPKERFPTGVLIGTSKTLLSAISGLTPTFVSKSPGRSRVGQELKMEQKAKCLKERANCRCRKITERLLSSGHQVTVSCI